MNRITLALSIFLLATNSSGWNLAALAADLTPDQQEQVKLQSGAWMLAYRKAEALKKEGKQKEAEAVYKKVLAERQSLGLDCFTESERLGELYMSMGRKPEAERVYRDLVAAREKLNGVDDPQVIEPLKLLAACLDKSGKKGEAASIRARAVKIDQDARSIPEFGKISLPANSPLRKQEGEKMRLLGEKYYRSDLQNKALAYFNRAILLNPDDAQALCDRGETYHFLEKLNLAKQDFEKAIKIKPDLARAYVGLALIHENFNANARAVAEFDKAIQFDPKNAETIGDRAKLLDTMGRHQEAISGYTRAIEADPALYWTYIQRGLAYESLGKNKEAIADYTTLINRAPSDYDFVEMRAKVYARMAEYEKAIADYTRVIQLNPQYSIAYKERAQLYRKLDGKNTPRVVADLEMARKLGYN